MERTPLCALVSPAEMAALLSGEPCSPEMAEALLVVVEKAMTELEHPFTPEQRANLYRHLCGQVLVPKREPCAVCNGTGRRPHIGGDCIACEGAG